MSPSLQLVTSGCFRILHDTLNVSLWQLAVAIYHMPCYVPFMQRYVSCIRPENYLLLCTCHTPSMSFNSKYVA